MRSASLARAFPAGLVLAAGLLSSCDGANPLGVSDTTITDVVQARALWEARAPREYSFELAVSCFCPDLRPVIVRVLDDVVRDVRHADDLTPIPLESSYSYPSLVGIFEIVEQAVAGGAFSVSAEFDAVYGYPRVVSIDPWEGIADDGHGYVVSKVTRR